MYSNIKVTTLSAYPSWIDALWRHVGPFQKPTSSPVHTKNEAFSKRYVFKKLHFWNRFGKLSFLSVFSGVVDDRRKRIKTFAALTENALVWMAPQTTSCPSFSSARVERANYACACEKRYPRGKVTRTRREGGRRVTLSPWPCLLHPYLLVGRRGKRNTLLFGKRSRRRLRWCCLSLMGRGIGECHRLYAVALAESYELQMC